MSTVMGYRKSTCTARLSSKFTGNVCYCHTVVDTVQTHVFCSLSFYRWSAISIVLVFGQNVKMPKQKCIFIITVVSSNQSIHSENDSTVAANIGAQSAPEHW